MPIISRWGLASLLLFPLAASAAQPLGCLIEPYRVSDVGSPVIGVIDRTLVERGERVQAGQPIATLRSDVERQSVAVALSKAQAVGELQAAEANAALARQKLARARDLAEQNFISSQAPEPGYTVSNGVLTDASYAGVAGIAYGIYDMIARTSSAKSNYVTLDADWQITDSLSSKFELGSSKGTGLTSKQYIAEVTTAIGGGAQYQTHGIGSPVDWSLGGYTGPAATGFGTWGNQMYKTVDEEKFGTADFTQYFDSGVLSSIDFGVRYANHTRQVFSPEGASPGAIGPALEANGVTGKYPSDFGSGIGGNAASCSLRLRSYPATPSVLAPSARAGR